MMGTLESGDKPSVSFMKGRLGGHYVMNEDSQTGTCFNRGISLDSQIYHKYGGITSSKRHQA